MVVCNVFLYAVQADGQAEKWKAFMHTPNSFITTLTSLTIRTFMDMLKRNKQLTHKKTHISNF